MELMLCLLFSMQSAEREALSSGRPVLVFRNCEPIPGPWLCYRCPCAKYDDEQVIVVSVVRKGRLVFRALVNPGAGAEQVLSNVIQGAKP